MHCVGNGALERTTDETRSPTESIFSYYLSQVLTGYLKEAHRLLFMIKEGY